MKRVALYARVSTREQANSELPIEGQLQALRLFFSARGYEIVKEYIDAGRSAYTHLEKRVAFRDLINAAKRREFQYVGIWKVDRFSRSLRDGLNCLYELVRAGVDIISITESGIDSTPAGELQRNMLLAFAQYFSEQHSQNVRRGMLLRFQEGAWPGGIPPYGYYIEKEKRKGRNLKAHPLESLVVREIFSKAHRGEFPGRIAHSLNKRGFRSRYGMLWDAGRIGKILRSEIYLGNRVGKFGRRNASHEALVSALFYDKVQLLIDRRKSFNVHARCHRSDYLLTPYLRCTMCGGKMHGKTIGKPRHHYYVCSGHTHRGTLKCSAPSIRKRILEEKVIMALRNNLSDATQLRELIGKSTSKGAPSVIAAQRIKSLSLKYARLLNDGDDGIRSIITEVIDGIKFGNNKGEMVISLPEKGSRERIKILGSLGV